MRDDDETFGRHVKAGEDAGGVGFQSEDMERVGGAGQGFGDGDGWVVMRLHGG